ncbi:hypothetical protein [Hirschia baltica]|uniref:Uncharacterized protein n=1 Tax=Hirschia baltica (strain ATCC 49814 / DSM 5838 / IFAM 1418) TaxID=582402 RepID=C6XKS9_HIRBI|nr:hypothetical protein [Hirschia baltica]ACT59646.1 hypothetical protein Hbal_1962 [Hirschia baltica ATCC 49814]
MPRSINGREALEQLDESILRARKQLAHALEASDDARARIAQIRKEQVSTYQSLAEMRLETLTDDTDAHEVTLLNSEKRAQILLQSHEAFIADEQEKLKAASQEILRLENDREEISSRLDAAVELYEKRVSKIQASLVEDEDYQLLAEAMEDAAAITERAHSKLALAQEDREQKGQPYENDPLFSYLWSRKFRTPDYKAPAFIRFLDNWVAKLCKYDQSYLNYGRLTELPVRLSEHAQKTQQSLKQASQALEAAETQALTDGGADTLKKNVDELRSAIEALDAQMDAAEARHQALAQSHDSAINAESGPAMEARRVLENALKRASFPDLRILVAETITPEDDRLVDRLVKLRTEELEFEVISEDLENGPKERRKDLSLLERLRREFKAAKFDSPYATFKTSSIETVITALLRGHTNISGARRLLNKAIVRRTPRVDPEFGGKSRSSTLGLPSIFGDIAIEIAKEAARQSTIGGSGRNSPFGGRPTTRRFPSKRSSSGIKFPSSGGFGGKGGGFKTGGGF